MSLLLFLLALLAAPARAEAATTAPGPDTLALWSDAVVRIVVGPAVCSGVVIDDAGTVATAYHCVAAGRRAVVETRGGDLARGRVIGTAARDDLALISVPDLAGSVAPRPLRTTPLRPGEPVVAIGHPLGGDIGRGGPWEGMLGWALSHGVVSAVGPRMIQTDAALNPGTSGGPVFDHDGAVVGIISRKLRGEGLSFLAHVDRLAALADAPRTPALGGTVGLGLGLSRAGVGGAATTLSARPTLTVRDRLVLGMAAGLPLDARARALDRGAAVFPSLELSAGLRQRIGHGPFTTTVELGGGMLQLADVTAEWSGLDGEQPSVRTVLRPQAAGGHLYGRLGLSGGALRVQWRPGASDEGTDPAWVLGIDLDLPGVLGTF